MPNFFSDGPEFEILETMFKQERFSRMGEGPGDDGFILKFGGKKWAVSSDVSVENVHYKSNWAPPETALEKAVLSNLSDINAMGGKCRWLFFNLGARESWKQAVFTKIGRTLEKMERKYGFRICGGDIVRTKKNSFFSFTAMGEVKGRPLLRSNAKPGHEIYVTGGLGSAAAGLRLLSGKNPLPSFDFAQDDGGEGEQTTQLEKLRKRLIARYHKPSVPLDLGPILSREKGPVAAIDISDGLSSELWHLSRQSGTSLIIDWNRLPVYPGLDKLFTGRTIKNAVLHGGDDYGLIFTGNFTRACLKKINSAVKVFKIGRVIEGEGVFLCDERGREKPLKPGGWSH